MDGRRKSVVLLHKVIALKSTQIFLVASICVLTLFTTLLCVGFLMRYEVDSDVSSLGSVSYWNDKISEEQKIWFDKGIEELRTALKLNDNKDNAKNVIVFVAHGITPVALASARFNSRLLGKLPQDFIWDKFPHVAKLKNSCGNQVKCDLFTAATSLYGGVKTKTGFGGLDTAAPTNQCNYTDSDSHDIKSIIEHAQANGLRTGFITTGRITSPTIAALYAHVPNTQWECNAEASATHDCLDVATQLIEEKPGALLNVIMGGGRQILISNASNSIEDPIDENVCRRLDSRNFLRVWRAMKRTLNQRYSLVEDQATLKGVNGSDLDYVLGVFANGDLDFERRQKNSLPKLFDMTTKAIEVLKRDEIGFLLLVESKSKSSDSIDRQIEDILQLNASIARAADLVSDDTLILTLFTQDPADGTVSSEKSSADELAFHGDTLLFAKGARSYLFQSLHDETYMAHVINLSLRMGEFTVKQRLI